MTTHGKLFLVPTPLDFGCEEQAPLNHALPALAIEIAARLEHWICENAKSARAFLKRVNESAPLAIALQSQDMQELPREVHKKGDHTGSGAAAFDAKKLLAPALAGHDIGLLSEAGMPAIADPGSSVVRAAHELGIEVIALPGPTSLLLGLAASGLSGQNFAFVGYLPQEPTARATRIRELEALALRTGQTQIFIETPYRNAALITALVQTLQQNTRLSVSSGLTLASARTRSAIVKTWKQWLAGQPGTATSTEYMLGNDTPAIFALGR